MKNQTAISRRNFLSSAAAGATLAAAQRRASAQDSPNDTIVLGLIGAGGMGTSNMNSFLRESDARVAAICDVDSDHREKAAAEAEKRQGSKPELFHDFRKLLERDDIDAVVIATPDHWHALPFITACQAGKDIYVEKPLSRTIGEGRRMLEAAKAAGRVTQLGTIIHNDNDNYRRVVEMVRSGNLGKITRVQCWKSTMEKEMGHPPDGEPPAPLDYDFWLGPAPMRPYNPNRSHFNFRYFWDYSGGNFIDFWCHITDVAYWALDLTAPLTASAAGGKWFLDDNTETPDCIEVLYQYPGDITLNWSVHPNPLAFAKDMGNIGCAFVGTEGTLATNYSKNAVYVNGGIVEDFPRPDPSIPNSPGHRREFLDCVKSREACTCNIEYAHTLTKGGHLGNIAYRTGALVEWDDENERVTNHECADSLVRPVYRKPWVLG